MDIQKCKKDSFAVIGKEGSTKDGEGFVQKLWETANNNYNEIAALVKIDAKGNPAGFWGAMSDFSRSFLPWENNFSEGIYLAGAEVRDDCEAPFGWTKWVIPAYEYLYIKVQNDVSDIFPSMIKYIKENGFELVGAVHDYICPEENGQPYMFFPIRRL